MDDNTPFEDLPRSWQKKIRSLRAECGESRVQLRETREELAELVNKVNRLTAAECNYLLMLGATDTMSVDYPDEVARQSAVESWMAARQAALKAEAGR